MNYTITLPILVATLLILPACGPQYQVKQLKHLSADSALFEQTKDNVLIRVHPLDTFEENALFDGRGYYLAKNRPAYQAIQITIFNKTDHTYIIAPELIDLKLVPADAIIEAIQFNTTARAIIPLAIGTAGIITRIATADDRDHCVAGDSIMIAAATGGTAAVQNAGAKDSNDTLADDVIEKTLPLDGLVIRPFEKVSTLIFVQKRFMRHGFMLSLQRNDGSLLNFEVTL